MRENGTYGEERLKQLLETARQQEELLPLEVVKSRLAGKASRTPVSVTIKTLVFMSASSILLVIIFSLWPQGRKATNLKALPQQKAETAPAVKQDPGKDSPLLLSSTPKNIQPYTEQKTGTAHARPGKPTATAQPEVQARPTAEPTAMIQSESAVHAGQPDTLEVKRTVWAADPAISLSGIKLIQLSEKDLAKLDVTVSSAGICLKSKNLEMCFGKEGTDVKLNRQASPLQATAKVPFPRLITDDLGTAWRVWSRPDSKPETKSKPQPKHSKRKHTYTATRNYVPPSNSDTAYWRRQAEESAAEKAKIAESINTLVPILVRSGQTYTQEDSLQKNERPDVILWYEPTDTLLSLLPEEISQPIQREYTALKDTGSNVQHAASSCTYFEVCRSTLKDRLGSVQLYPNPAKGVINLSIELPYRMALSMSLLDISGKSVYKLMPMTLLEEGKQEFRYNVPEVKPGMYILSINAGDGSFYTQRLILQ